MSQYSPSSVGVVSVSSGSWPWNRIWRWRCRNCSAARLTPGKFGSAASAFASSGSSVHFFDQSERTITTDPLGIRPCRRSNRWMSATDSAYFGSLLDLLDDRDHDQRPHRVGRRQLVDARVLRRPVRRRVELGAELVRGDLGTRSPRSRRRRRCRRSPVAGFDRRLERRRPEPAPDRHVRGDVVRQVDVGRPAAASGRRASRARRRRGGVRRPAVVVAAVLRRRRPWPAPPRRSPLRRSPRSCLASCASPFASAGHRNDCLSSAFELLPA